MSVKTIVKSALASFGLELHKVFPHTYFNDGLRTLHDSSFTDDPRFAESYQRGLDLTPTQVAHQGKWRAHIATWAADTAIRRDGDFVECGVWFGFVSSVAMNYVDWNKTAGNRRFFLIDSFEGLSEDMMTEEEKNGVYKTYNGRYSGALERAKHTMNGFRNVEFVKGYVPDILSAITTDKVAYLHLDMNSALPEVEALKFFWPKMTTGGVVLFDDYVYTGYKPQKIALDEVANSFGVTIASLPTGQGLLIK